MNEERQSSLLKFKLFMYPVISLMHYHIIKEGEGQLIKNYGEIFLSSLYT